MTNFSAPALPTNVGTHRPTAGDGQAPVTLHGFSTESNPPVNPQSTDSPTGVCAPALDGDRYFPVGVNGKPVPFRVRTLAQDIVRMGPLASGIDGHIWEYADGVYRRAPKVIHERAAYLMGQRFRLTHVKDAEAIIRAQQPTIRCEPIPEYINFRNCLYEWKTGRWWSHTPAIHSTVQLATNWNPNATCPEFDKFLASVVPPDVVSVTWELISYLMYNGNPLHKAVMLHGTGRNGKGTFLRLLIKLLGRVNVTAVSLQALASERFGPANLFGKLANIAGDIDGTYLEQTAMFKAITGEDTITAELKFKDAFEFTPFAVPVFSANKIPGSADVTTGYLSRWVVIPFPNDFTGREDRSLDYRLQQPSEIEGIAAKALVALDHLMARGNFEEPPSAKSAMEDFRRKVDQVRTWLEDEWVLDNESTKHVSRKVLLTSYTEWAKEGNYGKLRAGELYDRLRALGLPEKTLNGDRGFHGLRCQELPLPRILR